MDSSRQVAARSPGRIGCDTNPSRSRVSPNLGFASAGADATTCAAQIALADAVTARTAAILLDQLNGALAAACRAAIAAISASDWPRATELVGQLLDHRDLGLHLTTPWRVVLAGPPNVGKSSLINALAGYERAIVSPVPGTTRDVVTLTTAIDGWPVELADTAGLRATDDELESAGVRLAEAALASADLVIVVRDATSQDAGWWTVPATRIAAADRTSFECGTRSILPAAAAVAGVGDDPARRTAIISQCAHRGGDCGVGGRDWPVARARSTSRWRCDSLYAGAF